MKRRSSWEPTAPCRFSSAWTVPPPRRGWLVCGGLARRQQARVTAVYVCSGVGGAAVTGAAAGLVAARREADEQITDDMRRRAGEFSQEFGVPSPSSPSGVTTPFTELRRVADEIRADAVVVGASAHAGHRLVGSLGGAAGEGGPMAGYRGALSHSPVSSAARPLAGRSGFRPARSVSMVPVASWGLARVVRGPGLAAKVGSRVGQPADSGREVRYRVARPTTGRRRRRPVARTGE